MSSRVFPTQSTQCFRKTQIQTCIVHLLRNSLDYAGWKDRKPVVTALKSVYRAPDAAAAATALTEFEEGPWGRKYPAITAARRRNWEKVIPFLPYPLEVRRMIYTTNAIESLNSTLRRSVRARGHFPSDEAATKLIWLQLREVTKDWKMPAREWHAAKAQFALVFGDRFEMNH
jgi:putative transposase